MLAKSGSFILFLRQSGPKPTGIEEGWVRAIPHEQHLPSCWKETLFALRMEGSLTAWPKKAKALANRLVGSMFLPSLMWPDSWKMVPAKTIPCSLSPRREMDTKKMGSLILRSCLSRACLTLTVMWVPLVSLLKVRTARPAKKRSGRRKGLTVCFIH